MENYCLANDATLQLQSGKTRDGIAAIIEKSRADSAKSGITDKAPLFVYLDMRNIKVPTLHIRLGLGNELVYAIRDFIRNFVEIDTDEIIDARLTLREAEDDLNEKKQAKQDYMAANEDDYDAGRKSIAAYDKISKTRRFVNCRKMQHEWIIICL